jgi:hypothetical protein
MQGPSLLPAPSSPITGRFQRRGPQDTAVVRRVEIAVAILSVVSSESRESQRLREFLRLDQNKGPSTRGSPSVPRRRSGLVVMQLKAPSQNPKLRGNCL